MTRLTEPCNKLEIDENKVVDKPIKVTTFQSKTRKSLPPFGNTLRLAQKLVFIQKTVLHVIMCQFRRSFLYLVYNLKIALLQCEFYFYKRAKVARN